MASSKSFKTYTPTEGSQFDINGVVFRLQPSVPGDLLLDFLAGTEEEDSGKTATMLRQLFQTAIIPEDYEKWTSFIRNPANNVTLGTLIEIARHVAEVMSGNPTERQPEPFMSGL